MLPGGLDGAYRKLLAGPHMPVTRVEVWANGVRIDPYGSAPRLTLTEKAFQIGVPFGQGSVSGTLNSRVARVLAMTFDRTLFPADPSGLLAPFGNYLKVYSGIKNWGGPDYMWQVFYGRINDITLSDTGNVALTAVDLAGDVQDAYFGHPFQSQTGTLIGAMYRTLIRGAIPTATFGAFDDNANIQTPNLIWENDRASACDSLAQAGNTFWYPLANGDFVLRQVAWTDSKPPLLTLYDGEAGTLFNWSVGYSRTNVANGIIVSGELADGSTPVYGVATDTNPLSPTYVNGKYGIKTQFISAQAAVTQGQATTLANAYLAQAKALTDTWSAQIPPDAALELGDCMLLKAGGRKSSNQVVSSFVLGLDSADTMNVNFRAQVPTNTPLPDA